MAPFLRWPPFCIKIGFGHKEKNQLADLNDLGGILNVLNAAGIIYYGYLTL